MKKIFSFVFAFFLLLSVSGCNSQQDLLEEMEQFKAEYAVYDQYAELIDALEAKDFSRAQNILEAYEASDYNQQIADGQLQEIVITSDNWTEYFEVKKITQWLENDVGETTGFITHAFIVVKDEFVNRIYVDKSDIAFKWTAMCSVKNCDVDLVNRMVAFENLFKSNSTTFGEPEQLSGTVVFNMGEYNSEYLKEYGAAAEIAEIVIVGEYLLGAEMKPVCFDYDEITLTQAEGVLVLRNFGE